MDVLVAGSSGFVGSRLCPELERAGHTVRAMTRRPHSYHGAGQPIRGDVHDRDSLRAAMDGCQAAYYLVHSLDDPKFEQRDADAARTFGEVAAEAGLERIVYLGGLGAEGDDLSPHLRSRRAVERLLGVGGVPVTTLRAGVIIGHGGISWEVTRQLVEHLPAMVTPKWVHVRTQPIALDDVVRYLVGVLDEPETTGRTFEIGGPYALTFADMLRRVADLEGRPLILVPVPLLSPWLSSLWLSLVTDVDSRTGRSLVGSMVNETVVHDDSIRELLPFEPLDYDEAVLRALRDRVKARHAA
ncbi:NAD(P)H-binding protein [Nocardia sp. NPDC003482]